MHNAVGIVNLNNSTLPTLIDAGVSDKNVRTIDNIGT